MTKMLTEQEVSEFATLADEALRAAYAHLEVGTRMLADVLPELDAIQQSALRELKPLADAGRAADAERVAAVVLRLVRGRTLLEAHDLLDTLEQPAITTQDIGAMASQIEDVMEAFESRLNGGEDWSEIETDVNRLRAAMARDVRHLSRAGRFGDLAIHASTLDKLLARVQQLRPHVMVH